LLTKNPDKRIGTNNIDDIKNHPFFEGIVWDDILNKRIRPPFKPMIRSKKDVANFDTHFTREPAMETPEMHNKYLNDDDFDNGDFDKFDFK
jgi:hypothetical protein